MCVSACTMVGHNERFPGPAALNRALTLELDHRDDGREARWRVLLSDDALARRHGQGNCTEVCPMSLSPADSIRRLRRRALTRLLAHSRATRIGGDMLGATRPTHASCFASAI